ncbi:MAG: T9SS type A sorting domain-containing protein, partial [Saprospiraceae bacterium]
VLLAPHSYNIDFYVDVNNNGTYDAPLTDHAWRRVLITPDKDTIVNFHPGETFTDITFPGVFPYNTYNATWGGKWRNLTFGTTDSIEAGFNVRCDSILGFFRTKGVFGNPAPVEYTSSNPRPADGTPIPDTLHYAVIPPWSGDIYFTNGELYGDLALITLGFHFRSTVGEKQMLGLYTITNSGIQLANGYFYVRELEIISSTPTLEAKPDVITNVSCAGLSDGAISVNAVGGTPPYTYLWSTSVITPDISSLPPGTYSVTVFDAEGCSTRNSFNITEPEPFFANVSAIDATCADICNGTIDLDIFGGTPPYHVYIPEDLCAGSFDVLVTDDRGCLFDTAVFIKAPGPILVDINVIGATCADACDGIIELEVTGGAPPYSYHFLNDFCEGLNTVFITDANGCQIQKDFFMFSPDPIIIVDTVIINATDGQSNGEINIISAGGIPPFQYSLNGFAFQVSNVFTGLPAGIFTCTIKDVNGCIFEFDFEIQNITAVANVQSNFTFYPNPASTEIYLQSDTPVSVEMLDVAGHVLTESPASTHHTLQVENLVSGMYILRISDGYGSAY